MKLSDSKKQPLQEKSWYVHANKPIYLETLDVMIEGDKKYLEVEGWRGKTKLYEEFWEYLLPLADLEKTREIYQKQVDLIDRITGKNGEIFSKINCLHPNPNDLGRLAQEINETAKLNKGNLSEQDCGYIDYVRNKDHSNSVSEH